MSTSPPQRLRCMRSCRDLSKSEIRNTRLVQTSFNRPFRGMVALPDRMPRRSLLDQSQMTNENTRNGRPHAVIRLTRRLRKAASSPVKGGRVSLLGSGPFSFPTARSVEVAGLGSDVRFMLRLNIGKRHQLLEIPILCKELPELKRSIDRLNRDFLSAQPKRNAPTQAEEP
jgi:hypothetical protein